METQYVVHPDIIGHIRKMLERLDDIEAELKMVKNQVAHNLLSLKSIENRVTRLEDDAISSDPTYT